MVSDTAVRCYLLSPQHHGLPRLLPSSDCCTVVDTFCSSSSLPCEAECGVRNSHKTRFDFRPSGSECPSQVVQHSCPGNILNLCSQRVEQCCKYLFLSHKQEFKKSSNTSTMVPFKMPSVLFASSCVELQVPSRSSARSCKSVDIVATFKFWWANSHSIRPAYLKKIYHAWRSLTQRHVLSGTAP